jgi:Haem-degrading/Oxidoreductase family, C-terminal alpha/beta domain
VICDPEPPPSGGGILRDFGSPLVDQAPYLFGPVLRVYAELHERGPQVEDDTLVLLQRANGVRTRLSGAWRQGAPAPRFRVTGTDGAFVIDPPIEGQERALIEGRSPADDGEAWGCEPQVAWGRVCRGDRSTAVPSERGRWDLFYEQLAQALTGAGPVPVGPWDAVATAAVLDAARRRDAVSTCRARGRPRLSGERRADRGRANSGCPWRSRSCAVSTNSSMPLLWVPVPTTTPGWSAKARVVARFHQSSLHVGQICRDAGRTPEEMFQLPDGEFAAHGRAFPITVAGVGVIGSVAVSGLPQVENHAFVVRVLRGFLSDTGARTKGS